MEFESIVLEWTDGIWKTTIAHELQNLNIWVEDRLPEFSSEIDLENFSHHSIEKIWNLLDSTREKLHIIMYYDSYGSHDTIHKRIHKRGQLDKHDKHFDKYNDIYKLLKEPLEWKHNVEFVNIDDHHTPYEIVKKVLSIYFKKHIQEIADNPHDFPVTLEWESKIYKRLWNTKVALAELKPTVYSFTHKRYWEVPWTDIWRNKIWAIIWNILNTQYSHFKYNNTNFWKYGIDELAHKVAGFKDDIFVSNFIDQVNDNTSLVVFEDKIAENMEVVFKNYFVWTWKHSLLDSHKYTTRAGNTINIWDKLSQTMIRFDWRNPVFDENWKVVEIPDWTIPEDLANEYIDVEHAKVFAQFVSLLVGYIFDEVWLETLDWCYFMNEDWTRIHSEISPDWLRLKLISDLNQSFDKDLWREWLPKSALTDKFKELHSSLSRKFWDQGTNIVR